jgi:hypothetical protein
MLQPPEAILRLHLKVALHPTIGLVSSVYQSMVGEYNLAVRQEPIVLCDW